MRFSIPRAAVVLMLAIGGLVSAGVRDAAAPPSSTDSSFSPCYQPTPYYRCDPFGRCWCSGDGPGFFGPCYNPIPYLRCDSLDHCWCTADGPARKKRKRFPPAKKRR